MHFWRMKNPYLKQEKKIETTQVRNLLEENTKKDTNNYILPKAHIIHNCKKQTSTQRINNIDKKPVKSQVKT